MDDAKLKAMIAEKSEDGQLSCQDAHRIAVLAGPVPVCVGCGEGCGGAPLRSESELGVGQGIHRCEVPLQVLLDHHLEDLREGW